MGIAALIIGIFALIFSFFPFVCYVGMFMALLSIIFGAVGIPSNHKGPAIAGLVLGIIAMIVSIIFGIAYCGMCGMALTV